MSVLYAIAMVILTIYGMNLLWLAVKYVAKSRLRQGAVPEMGTSRYARCLAGCHGSVTLV